MSAVTILFLSRVSARDFDVVAYNVENLFDADGVSLFDDYNASVYGQHQLARKLVNVSSVLRRFNRGDGPDVVILCEIEADQTPASSVGEIAAFLRKWSGTKAVDLLAHEPLEPELAGAPAYAWLMKQLADDGLAPYNVALGQWRKDPGHTIAQQCVILSHFPIIEQRTHETEGARGILEAVLNVDGARLYVFDNHWKSGASDPELERVRVGNATVMRHRLDEILRDDPHADVIVGGDFNSEYNQKQRNPEMPTTALNDVLGSQGDEAAMETDGGPDLYNLWFELPNARRGSDVYRGQWGTLMQLMLTRGLYDFRGVQYVDNSFAVAAFAGLNADKKTGLPIRWTFKDGGGGFSDHFPVVATFRSVDEGAANHWLTLSSPSATPIGPGVGVPVRIAPSNAIALSSWPEGREFREPGNMGKYFNVTGQVLSKEPFRIEVNGSSGGGINLWIHDPSARKSYASRHKIGERVHFVGELGRYHGEWEFVLSKSASK